MNEQRSGVMGEIGQPSGEERRPWICPNCGHFIVRSGTNVIPSHACAVSGTVTNFVPYIDNAQAMTIRSGVAQPGR